MSERKNVPVNDNENLPFGDGEIVEGVPENAEALTEYRPGDVTSADSNNNIRGLIASFDATDETNAALRFNCLSTADDRMSDHIGETLTICDYLAHTVTMRNQQTGNMEDAPRVVLITKDGKSFGCVSWGIFRATCNLVESFGLERFRAGIKIKIVQVNGKDNKKSLSFKLA